MSGQPTAAFHHALLQQSIIRILLAAPTFPSPSTTITVPSSAPSSAPHAASFSRASASAVHLLGEVFRRIMCKYAADAGMNAERERRASVRWGDVIRAMERVNGPAAMEELMEWCISRGTEGAEDAATEGARLQRPRLAAAKDEEEGDVHYHFVPLPATLYERRDLLDERDREAQQAAVQLSGRARLPSDDEDESSSGDEEDWPLSLLKEAEQELIHDDEVDEPVQATTAPHSLPPPIPMDTDAVWIKKEGQQDGIPRTSGLSAPNGHREPEEGASTDVDAMEVDPESPAEAKVVPGTAQSKELPSIPAPPKSSMRRRKVPPVPIDASLTSGANSYLTPASTLTGSSTDPALLHMGKQRRTMALVLSDPQRFGPAASLYGAAPPARSGSEPGNLPFVPGPSLLITLPRPGASSAAPFFTPVHPYGRTAGGAGAPPAGSLTTVYRHNSDLFLAARTVCDPSLLRRATRTDDPAPLLDESFAERVFQGWPAERDLLEQAALGRGVLAPAVRVLKREKEVKRADEGGGRKKKKRKKVGTGLAGGSSGVKGKGRQTGTSARGGGRGRGARGTGRPRPSKSKSIYVDDYDEDEFDEYLDDDAGAANDDDEEGGYGPRGAIASRRAAVEDDDDDDDSEDEDLKPPESGMLVHTWDWNNRDYAEAMPPSQRLRGRLRSGGVPGWGGGGGGGPPGVPAIGAPPPTRVAAIAEVREPPTPASGPVASAPTIPPVTTPATSEGSTSIGLVAAAVPDPGAPATVPATVARTDTVAALAPDPAVPAPAQATAAATDTVTATNTVAETNLVARTDTVAAPAPDPAAPVPAQATAAATDTVTATKTGAETTTIVATDIVAAPAPDPAVPVLAQVTTAATDTVAATNTVAAADTVVATDTVAAAETVAKTDE